MSQPEKVYEFIIFPAEFDLSKVPIRGVLISSNSSEEAEMSLNNSISKAVEEATKETGQPKKDYRWTRLNIFPAQKLLEALNLQTVQTVSLPPMVVVEPELPKTESKPEDLIQWAKQVMKENGWICYKPKKRE